VSWCDYFLELIKYLLYAAFAFAVHYLMQMHAVATAKELSELEFSVRDLAIALAAIAIFRITFDRLVFALFELEAPTLYDRVMM
jgi:hypothetical protein